MDPATAIGVASASLAFLDFAIKITSSAWEIQNSATGATRTNEYLELSLKETQNLQADLIENIDRTPHPPKRIAEISKDCTKEAKELQALLKRIRGGEGKSLKLLCWRTTQARLTRSEVQQRTDRLKNMKDQLDTAIITEILKKTNTNHLVQSRQYQALKHSQKKVLRDVYGLRSLVKGETEKIRDFTNKDHIETRAVLGTQIDGVGAILTSEFKKSENAAKDSSRQAFQIGSQRDFKRSLEVANAFSRQRLIEMPSSYTCDWMFTHTAFLEWLSKPKVSPFWAQGKAGSGKSILMNYIHSHGKTVQCLRKWANEPIICTFFFWKAGKDYPNSPLDVLQSLLFQICDSSDAACSIAVNFISAHKLKTRPWTQKLLLDTLRHTLKESRAHVCYFIDGLDECTCPGQEARSFEILWDLILQLDALPQLKLCMSSRYIPTISNYMQKKNVRAQLRLQDMNRSDLLGYVHAKLGECYNTILTPTSDRLDPYEIVDKADGVFLWASLVTNKTVQSYHKGTSVARIRKQIQRTPQELKDLWKELCAGVDEDDTDQLRFFLRLMHLTRNFGRSDGAPSIALISLALMLWEGSQRQLTAYQCDQTRVRLQVQSRGLLDVVHESKAGAAWTYVDQPNLPVTTLRSTNDLLQGLLTNDKYRLAQTRRNGHTSDTVLFYYHSLCPSWTHRSAYEFVIEQEASGLAPRDTKYDDKVLQCLLRAAIMLYASSPSPSLVLVSEHSQLSRNPDRLLRYTLRVISMYSGSKERNNTRFQVLDEFQSIFVRLDVLARPDNRGTQSIRVDETITAGLGRLWRAIALDNIDYCRHRLASPSKGTMGLADIAKSTGTSSSKLLELNCAVARTVLQRIDDMTK